MPHTKESTQKVLGRLDMKELKQASKVFRAINHELRLKVIKLLEDNEKLSVTQIYFKLRIEQSVASQHLAILRESHLLNFTREGKNIYYTLNQQKLDAVLRAVELLRPTSEEPTPSPRAAPNLGISEGMGHSARSASREV